MLDSGFPGPGLENIGETYITHYRSKEKDTTEWARTEATKPKKITQPQSVPIKAITLLSKPHISTSLDAHQELRLLVQITPGGIF